MVTILKSEDTEVKKLVQLFLSDAHIPRYVLGLNRYAQTLAADIDIDGFIDDFSQHSSFLGKPVVKPEEIAGTSIVVSSSMAIYPVSAVKRLKDCGIQKIINYLDIRKYSSLALEMPFFDKAAEDYAKNKKQYDLVYNKLFDEGSKQVFHDILSSRVNQSFKSMQLYKVDPIGQYFEEFLDLGEGEVFADIGAFDGQTTIEFIRHCPGYKSCFVFEPSKENLAKAKNNLSGFRDIYLINKGLSDNKSTLRFADNSGSSNRLSHDGNVEIDVDRLDDLVHERLTFIKMDIEGAESLAIEGMKNHILREYPKLAISVYHNPDDLWKIPEQIFAIRDDYNIYLRHYTEGTDETVMFFIPSA